MVVKPGAEAEKPQAAAPGTVEGQPPKAPEAKPAAAKPAAEEAKGPKGAAQPAKVAAKEEPAATPKPNYEELYKTLQKAHVATKEELAEAKSKASIGDTFLQRMDSLERRLDMRDGEAVMQRVESLVDMGKPEAADELATRELARRMSVLNIDLKTDPRVAHLKLVPPRVALHQYLTQEPSLLQTAATAPKPKTETPNADGAPPAPEGAREEKIGGKSLAEWEVEWSKKHGLFKGLPDQPAGQTLEGFGTGNPHDLFKEGLRQYHEGKD